MRQQKIGLFWFHISFYCANINNKERRKKLPTLDIKIWVEIVDKINIIKFEFFEKEMVSPMVLYRRSAMPEGI